MMNTAKQVMDEVVYTSMIESSNEFQTFNELPLVSEMDPKAAMMIFSCMTKKTFADDEVIYEAGTYSVSQMYLVLDGKINVKNESGYKYNSLRKGDVFGLFSFLDEDRKHSVTAKGDELQISHELGFGASGIISKALWKERFDVALKAFRGDITSDGMPEDEMAISIAAGEHKNLVDVVGKLTGHPENKDGLLLSLIADDFVNLAGPPSLSSCTRDTYAEGQTFSLEHVLHIISAIASVSAHLHDKAIIHGDLYGHNILINPQADCILGDFGAATQYTSLNQTMQHGLEQLEVRAFGCLLEELIDRVDSTEPSESLNQLKLLATRCLQENVNQRPLFNEISELVTSV